MRLEELSAIISEMEIVFAYDHFAEGEARTHPLSVICFREATISLRTGRRITRSMK